MQRLLTACVLGLLCSACGGGGSNITPDAPTPIPTAVPTAEPTLEPTSTPEPTPVPTPGADEVIISGTITFEKVPHTAIGALDYDNATDAAVRGVRVSLLNGSAETVSSTRTDASGGYQLIAPANTEVRVVVDASLQRNDAYQWDFEVLDNTQNEALYSLSGSLASSGTGNSTRDLHAPSGWNRTIDDYTNITQRPAAPFAILDAIYEALNLLMDSEDSFDLPGCNLYWSYRNNTAAGDSDDGDIGTTFYAPSEHSIYVLGDADVDTDEFDFSVIQHEFTHFIEDVLSRSDSLGGAHGLDARLDMRLAFSEGLANAFTAMASGTGMYFDSSGTGQAGGFPLNLEHNSIGSSTRGWFNENSVGLVLYDIFDSQDDGEDTLSLGFTPIYDTLTRSDFTNNAAFSTIFLFADVFSSNQSANAATGLEAILAGENIHSSNRYGAGETNDGGIDAAVPVYHELQEGSSVNVCSSNAAGEDNRLGVSAFVRFTLAMAKTPRIVITRVSGESQTDPDGYVYRNGELIANMLTADANVEDTLSASRSQSSSSPRIFPLLSPGDYVLEVVDFNNSDGSSSSGGNNCFAVSLN